MKLYLWNTRLLPYYDTPLSLKIICRNSIGHLVVMILPNYWMGLIWVVLCYCLLYCLVYFGPFANIVDYIETKLVWHSHSRILSLQRIHTSHTYVVVIWFPTLGWCLHIDFLLSNSKLYTAALNKLIGMLATMIGQSARAYVQLK